MSYMNEYDIELALRVSAEFPNLHRAAKTLDNLKEWTNANSDGWPYWIKPRRAAANLVGLILTAGSRPAADISESELSRALTPIKSFLTKHGVNHADIIAAPAAAPADVRPDHKYLGVIIRPATNSTIGRGWYAYIAGRGMLQADTLAGIKRMIKESTPAPAPAPARMGVTVNFDARNNVLTVVVEHANWQSYSRAVGPRANRAYREFMRENAIYARRATRSANYYVENSRAGRSMSVFTYTLSN